MQSNHSECQASPGADGKASALRGGERDLRCHLVTVEGPEDARRQRLAPDNKARLNEGKGMRGKKGLRSDDVTGALDPAAPEAGPALRRPQVRSASAPPLFS